MAKPSDKTPEELEEQRKAREKQINTRASKSVEDVFEEATEMSSREKSRLYNKWYKAVRKGSNIVHAKKLSKNYEIEEVLEEAKALTEKLVDMLDIELIENGEN